jgi:hypothetical protein
LVDIVASIDVGGKHVANLYIGRARTPEGTFEKYHSTIVHNLQAQGVSVTDDLRERLRTSYEKIPLRSLAKLEELITVQKTIWNKIRIDDIVYCENNENHIMMLANGVVSYTRTDENAFLQVQKDILALNDSSLSYSDRIYRAKQAIAHALKECAIGSNYEIPIRVQIAFSKLNNTWMISYLNLSYPFYYLLQDKNEFMHQIS